MDYSDDPDLMRCSVCGVIFERKNWDIRKGNYIHCICCGSKLKSRSMSKIAREKRDVLNHAKRY